MPKTCLQCHQIYDDSENFCQTDGAILKFISSESLLYSSRDTTTVIVQRVDSSEKKQVIRQGVHPAFGYLTIGLLALFAGGAIMLWIKSDSNPSSTSKNENTLKYPNSTGQKAMANTEQKNDLKQENQDLEKDQPRLAEENKRLEAKRSKVILTQTNRLEVINPNKFRKILVNQRVPNCQDSLENCGAKTLDLLGIKKSGNVETFIYPTKVGIYLVSREISDDYSVIGERIRIAFLIKQDGYEFVQIGDQNKCNSGANVNKWTKDSCN